MATISITPHQIENDEQRTFTVNFFNDFIHTTVTDNSNVVDNWIFNIESAHQYHLNCLVVGLDVEWRPSFSRLQNPAALLQLCVGRRCLIFQLLHAPAIPNSLVRFLSNPCYTFVGVAIEPDIERLQEDHAIGFNTNVVDLRELAANYYGRMEVKNWGLKDLAGLVLERQMKKPRNVTMSRWDNRYLTKGQVQYACVDAFVCFEIGRILNAYQYSRQLPIHHD